MSKPKIFVWVNSGDGTNWQVGQAIAEDGTFLGGHTSSSRDFFRMDMGLIEGKDWTNKREAYARHYPGGYELVEIEGGGEAATHPGLCAAIKAHAGQTPNTQSNKENL